MKTKNKWKLGLVGLIIIGLVLAYFLSPLGDYLSVDKITKVTEDISDSPLVALIFLGIFFVGGMILVPIPLMAFAVSLVFNIWVSILIVIPGFFLASIGGYYVGRIIDTDSLSSKLQNSIDKIKDKIDSKGAWAVMALRLAPTPPFTITSMISGALKIPFLNYAGGTVLGIAPLGISAVFFGKGAIKMMQEPSALAASSIGAAIILYGVYRVVKHQQSESDTAKEV